MTVEELYRQIGNYTDAKSRLMNDRLISKFVVKFLDDPSFAGLQAAWQQQNDGEIFRHAHTLKGVCANLALTRLTELSSTITEAYRPGQTTTESRASVSSVMDALGEEYERVTGLIRAFEA